MKPLLTISTAMIALAVLAPANAGAQQRAGTSGARITIPNQSHNFSWEKGHGIHGGFHGGIFIVEREVPVIVEREVVREVKAAEPPVAVAAPANPRKPYVIGGTYASLPPQGCMKLIEDGASYYFCGGGEWYRPLGDGRTARYRAVARP